MSNSRQQNRSILVTGVNVAAVTITNVMVARYWGAAIRGELAAATTVIGILTVLSGLGMPDVVVWAHGYGKLSRVVAGWCRASVLTAGVAGAIGGLAAFKLLHFNWYLGLAVAVGVPSTQALRLRTTLLLALDRLGMLDGARAAPLLLGLALVAVSSRVPSNIHPIVPVLAAQLATVVLLGPFSQMAAWGAVEWPSRDALRVGLLSTIGTVAQASLARRRMAQ